MAIIKAVSSRASISTAINYVSRAEKTDDKLITGVNCEAETAELEMQTTKELYGKTDGRTYKHFVQSYHESESITPEQAHKNALELVKSTKAFEGYEILVATHVDKNHIHSHFIVNSVNYENGYKLQWSKADLQDLKTRSNKQSIEQGLHVPEKGKQFSGQAQTQPIAFKKETYQILKKAKNGNIKSYVQGIAKAVLTCKSSATTKKDFMQQMKQKGYDVIWKDNRKYITFIDLERQQAGIKQCKVRDKKLQQYYGLGFEKKELLQHFDKAQLKAELALVKQQLHEIKKAEAKQQLQEINKSEIIQLKKAISGSGRKETMCTSVNRLIFKHTKNHVYKKPLKINNPYFAKYAQAENNRRQQILREKENLPAQEQAPEIAAEPQKIDSKQLSATSTVETPQPQQPQFGSISEPKKRTPAENHARWKQQAEHNASRAAQTQTQNFNRFRGR